MLVHKNGQNLGPYTLEEIGSQLHTGILSLDDYGWQEGMAGWEPLRSLLEITELPSCETENDLSSDPRQAMARAFCVVGGWSSPITDKKLRDIEVAISRCSAFKDTSAGDREAILAEADAVIRRDGPDGLGDVNEIIGRAHGQEMVKMMMELVLSWDPNADKIKQFMWHIPPDMGLSMDAYYKMWDRVAYSPRQNFATPGRTFPRPTASLSPLPKTETAPVPLPSSPPSLPQAKSKAPPLPGLPPSGRLQNEVHLLNQYADEIERLKGELSVADPGSAKYLQRQIEQKMQIFWKQISLVKSGFPNASEGLLGEALFYYFQAAILILSKGGMRRFAQGSAPLAMRLAAGAFAKIQESGEPARALQLLEKSIEICDTPDARYFKAHIYLDQGHKEQAIVELNHIIEEFPDDEVYAQARGLKDEIENPPKKGCIGCFVATAAYGSPLASEVVLLSRFRDEVLLTSWGGAKFVAFYYRVSPLLAALIGKSEFLRALTRKLLLAPVLRLLRSPYFSS